MNIAVILLLAASLSSAQNYFPLPGKVYSGKTSQNENCELQLNSDMQGWSVKVASQFKPRLLELNSSQKIEIRNAAWVSRDLMFQASAGKFDSLLDTQPTNKNLINVLMKCKLNSKNEPIAFTVDIQNARENDGVKRVVSCQIH